MSFISILIAIVSVLLTLVVLVQNSKGGGIASNFASTNQVMGVKRQNELVERITWILAGALLILCLSSSAFTGTGSAPVNKESVVKNAEAPPAPVNPNGNSPLMPQNNGPMTQPTTTGTNAGTGGN